MSLLQTLAYICLSDDQNLASMTKSSNIVYIARVTRSLRCQALIIMYTGYAIEHVVDHACDFINRVEWLPVTSRSYTRAKMQPQYNHSYSWWPLTWCFIEVDSFDFTILLAEHKNVIISYCPENKPPPPFSSVDMAQIGEGASPLQQIALLTISSQPILRSSSHRTETTLVFGSNRAAWWGATIREWLKGVKAVAKDVKREGQVVQVC